MLGRELKMMVLVWRRVVDTIKVTNDDESSLNVIDTTILLLFLQYIRQFTIRKREWIGLMDRMYVQIEST